MIRSLNAAVLLVPSVTPANLTTKPLAAPAKGTREGSHRAFDLAEDAVATVVRAAIGMVPPAARVVPMADRRGQPLAAVGRAQGDVQPEW